MILIGCAAVFAVSMFSQCNRSSAMGGALGSKEAEADAAVMIGNIPVPYSLIDASITAQTNKISQEKAQNAATPPGALTVREVVQANISGVALAVNQGLNVYLAEKSGVTYDDASTKEVIKQMTDDSVEQFKAQLLQQKLVPENATIKDIDAALTKLNQSTLTSMLEKKSVEVTEMVKNKAYGDIAGSFLVNKIRKEIPTTDSAVKSQFSTYQVKRIVFEKPGPKGETPKQLADTALAEIKAGTAFEAAINKYSNEVVPKTQKLSDKVVSARPSFAQLFDLQGLEGKKVGDVSDVVTTRTGALIYKVVGTKADVPADFDKNRANYVSSYVRTELNKRMLDMVKKASSDGTMKWKSKGYEALYTLANMAQLELDPTTSLKKVLDIAKSAVSDGNPADTKPAAIARYAAFAALMESPGVDKKSLEADKQAIILGLLDVVPDFDLQMQLADDYIAAKKGPEALEQIVNAARTNGGSFDVLGEQRFREIQGRALKLVSSNLVKQEALKDLDSIQNQWKKDKETYDTAKVAQEAEQKKLEEEAKKAMEAQKAKDAVKPTSPAPKK